MELIQFRDQLIIKYRMMITPLIYVWEIPIYLLVYSECLLGILSPMVGNDCYESLDLAISSGREKARLID